MTLQEFKSNFNNQELPAEMQLLFDFQDKFGAETYVAGFGLLQNDKSGLRYGWSDNSDFLNQLMPFAESGDGSMYCLWDNKTHQPINQMPVVYFDSDGEGENVIAKNFLEFIQILLIPDPYDDWRPENYANFVHVFNEKMNLPIPNNFDDVAEAAAIADQASFDTWKNQYVKN